MILHNKVQASKEVCLSAQELTICAMFTALIAVGAFIKITLPTQPIPMHFTLQWFFVILAGLLLRTKLAGLSVLVYLLLGLAGAPVFASGGGIGYLLKPTFGYLLGFLFAAYVMAFLKDTMKAEKSTARLIAVTTAGLLIYYGVGVIYFALAASLWVDTVLSVQVLLFNCFLSTVFEDFLLCVLAVILYRRVCPAFAGIFKKQQ